MHAREPDSAVSLRHGRHKREVRVLGFDVMDKLPVEIVGLDMHDPLGLRL